MPANDLADSRPLRLMQVMASTGHGGAEGFFVRLCVALARRGIDQSVVIRRGAAVAAELRGAGIEPVELPFRKLFDLTTGPRLRRLIARHRPTVVLSWMSRAAMLGPSPGSSVHVGRLGGYYDLKYYRRCDHLIGNTEDIVRYLVREGWPAERAHYLPNFVETRPVAPLSRAMFDTPKGAPLLVALGRLHPHKAFDTLLRALANLPGVILWLAGEGPDRAALEHLAGTLGILDRVRFLGWRDDAGALIAAADVLVCPSRVEPLGNVILEGWARARPVVAATAAGPLGLIRDGETGLLVPIDDAAALAGALGRLLADSGLAGRLGEAGWAEGEARFGERSVVDRYVELLSRLGARDYSDS
ncbi:MAG TPA: glycosyltransferase [Stellaceae bacterium]|nr:glycosyltransferase [Stellaceae bacterium]